MTLYPEKQLFMFTSLMNIDCAKFCIVTHWHTSSVGCAIAQAVSRQLPTSAAQLPAQVRSCGICGR
jgi:hypothetical protein